MGSINVIKSQSTVLSSAIDQSQQLSKKRKRNNCAISSTDLLAYHMLHMPHNKTHLAFLKVKWEQMIDNKPVIEFLSYHICF